MLYENERDGSSIEYDLPSSQLRQCRSAQIDALGRELDERLMKLVVAVQQ